MSEIPILLSDPSNDTPPNVPRLLLVSFHFPPSDTTGALRWQKLATHAAALGWGLDVLTRHPDDIGGADWTRLRALPAGVRVYGVRTPPRSAGRIESHIARWLRRLTATKSHAARLATDAPPSPTRADRTLRGQLRWSLRPGSLRKAYRAWWCFSEDWRWAGATLAAARNLPDVHAAIASCGPPHMPHLAALEIARRRRKPFIMDMRDPWSVAPALPNAYAHPLWYQLAEKYERRAARAASLIVANTEALALALRRKYPDQADRVLTVMNGCDEEDIPVVQRDQFVISYAGNIYIDRDPRPLFRAIRRVVEAEGIASDRLRIELVGHVEDFGGAPVGELARQEGVLDYLTIHPRVPRVEALRLMSRASVLVSLPQEVDLAIPSKIFEYMQFPARLLALAKPRSATAELLRTTEAIVASPDDVDSITEAIRDGWREFNAGRSPQPINRDDRFGRQAQARILFNALDRLRLP